MMCLELSIVINASQLSALVASSDKICQ